MPRVSKRAKAITTMSLVLNNRLKHRAIRELDDDEDSLEDLKDLATLMCLSKLRKNRYLCRGTKYRKSPATERFLMDLHDGGSMDSDATSGSEISDLPWLSADEFLQKYRVSRKSFEAILHLIKDHEVFKSKTKVMAPPEHQLMVFLKYVGTEGAGANNSNQRHTFGVGYGTAEVYRRRVTIALNSLADEYIKWPDAAERKSISQAIQEEFDFPHCVGIADGTLFPLASEPNTVDAPDYSGRKYGYSLTTMIICDHKRRIRHYLAGFPGSAHDNRVFKATTISKEPDAHFDGMQYLIGDSAFENQWFMVSAFKKPKDRPIPKKEEQFNEKLAKLRIISEHCIGMLKGRFPWLRSIRLLITEEKRSLKHILRLLKATVVLHNLLIELNEQDKNEWIDDDDFSDIDDDNRAPVLSPTDVINQSITGNAAKDERRKRLSYYFEEHFYF
jgi:DDE superfamily endonuclease